MSQARGCALITGASRGIGAATAWRLAQQGWPVALNCRSDTKSAQTLATEIKHAGGRATVHAGDVAEDRTPEDVYSAAEDEHGFVAVLVNNAGITADAMAGRMSDESWRDVLDLNLTGAFRMSRRAIGPMLRRRWGRIICVSSVVGHRANPGQTNYAAAKAGLEGMTRNLAVEVARRGITVNAVAPGLISTALTDNSVSESLRNAIPLRRAGTPEEVAACIGFLASEQARYVTGTTLTVDGGLSA